MKRKSYRSKSFDRLTLRNVSLAVRAKHSLKGEKHDGVPPVEVTFLQESHMNVTIYHADHGILDSHWFVILNLFEEAGDGFLLRTVELPDECPDLLSGIHGPIAGDEPVPSSEVRWAHRGDRKGLSRLCDRAPRPTRRMTVIGIREGDTVKVFTAYGGECAPREITDPNLPPEAAEEAAQFWSVHALSAE